MDVYLTFPRYHELADCSLNFRVIFFLLLVIQYYGLLSAEKSGRVENFQDMLGTKTFRCSKSSLANRRTTATILLQRRKLNNCVDKDRIWIRITGNIFAPNEEMRSPQLYGTLKLSVYDTLVMIASCLNPATTTKKSPMRHKVDLFLSDGQGYIVSQFAALQPLWMTLTFNPIFRIYCFNKIFA